MTVIGDFLTFLGTTNGSGRWYLWWSGMFGNLAIFGGVIAIYRKHTCHIDRCWRFGHHPAATEDGSVVSVCRRHHPGDIPKRLKPHHLRSLL